MAILKFFCDESHDSTNQKRNPGDPPFEPKSYVVGGFFADAKEAASKRLGWPMGGSNLVKG